MRRSDEMTALAIEILLPKKAAVSACRLPCCPKFVLHRSQEIIVPIVFVSLANEQCGERGTRRTPKRFSNRIADVRKHVDSHSIQDATIARDRIPRGHDADRSEKIRRNGGLRLDWVRTITLFAAGDTRGVVVP